MEPPPPVRLTGTTGWGRCLDMRSAKSCPIVWAVLPNRMVISIGFSGNLSAFAGANPAMTAKAEVAASSLNFRAFMFLSQVDCAMRGHNNRSCPSMGAMFECMDRLCQRPSVPYHALGVGQNDL